MDGRGGGIREKADWIEEGDRRVDEELGIWVEQIEEEIRKGRKRKAEGGREKDGGIKNVRIKERR